MDPRQKAGAPQGTPLAALYLQLVSRSQRPNRLTTSTVHHMTKPSVDIAMSSEPQDPAELARALRAQLATVTGGLAPGVYVNAWWDWYLNLAKEPPKQLQIMQDAIAKTVDNWSFGLRAAAGQPLSPAEGDDRYRGDAWAQWPFNVYARSYR